MPVTWSIQTPTTPGAVAIIQLTAASAAELGGAMASLGINIPAVGRAGVRNLCGVDRGVVARWSDRGVHLMPHGGPAVVRGIARALADAGFAIEATPDPQAMYPEARTLIEARMLAALARAASPLAVDLLLDQPRRWERAEEADASPWSDDLNRLITPPLVVAIGPANIGKSTLANILAGRTVSIVADEPGTTRDHVGALIDMAGLVVRYVDTPGVRAAGNEIEAAAAALAGELARGADLILACGDSSAPPPPPPDGVPRLTVATRIDLGRPLWPCDTAVSALDARGLADLVGRIRERLVPAAALNDPRPWRFWDR